MCSWTPEIDPESVHTPSSSPFGPRDPSSPSPSSASPRIPAEIISLPSPSKFFPGPANVQIFLPARDSRLDALLVRRLDNLGNGGGGVPLVEAGAEVGASHCGLQSKAKAGGWRVREVGGRKEDGDHKFEESRIEESSSFQRETTILRFHTRVQTRHGDDNFANNDTDETGSGRQRTLGQHFALRQQRQQHGTHDFLGLTDEKTT